MSDYGSEEEKPVGSEQVWIPQTVAESDKKPSRRKKAETEEGAKIKPTYHHRPEDYVLVTRNDLNELKMFGVIQQVLFGMGMFFFSGAFWLLWDLLVEQTTFKFTPWMGDCILSMIMGITLLFLGIIMFLLRQRRLKSYLPIEDVSKETT